jgi:hypothetical protein
VGRVLRSVNASAISMSKWGHSLRHLARLSY